MISGRLPRQPRREARTHDQNPGDKIPLGEAPGSGKANDAAFLQLLSPNPIVAMPTGPIILGQDGEDIQNICHWYFLNQLHEKHAPHFRHVHDHWTNGLWEMARVNQSMFAAIGAIAFYKEITLSETCSTSAYIKQKGHAMCRISKSLGRSNARPDPLTLVAVAILAYMDVRDSRFDDARLHLRAVSDLVNMADMPAYAWLYCVWIDLRYALLTAQMPILPHRIPLAFRKDSHQWPDSTQTIRKAFKNVSDCPQTAFFDHQMAFDLFNKLHALCFYSDRLEDFEVPPFGQVYDLEYSLRTIQSQACQEKSPCRAVAGVELMIWAAQLHVWMACRFWTPQRRETHLALVSRSCIILDEFGDAMTTWTDFASVESLLWVLFTMIATARMYGYAHETRLLDLLHSNLMSLGICSRKELSSKLAEWPWLCDWHPAQVENIWTMLNERFDDLIPEALTSYATIIPRARKDSQQRLFLGGLEFFNSL